MLLIDLINWQVAPLGASIASLRDAGHRKAAENAFDKKYIMDAGNTGDSLGMPTFIAGAPRFHGISASFRFGGARSC